MPESVHKSGASSAPVIDALRDNDRRSILIYKPYLPPMFELLFEFQMYGGR